jgi:hypothetical protein
MTNDACIPGTLGWPCRPPSPLRCLPTACSNLPPQTRPAPSTDRRPRATARYVWISGTSMASPHVAGVAALVRQMNPALPQGAVAALLRATATPMPRPLGWSASDPRICTGGTGAKRRSSAPAWSMRKRWSTGRDGRALRTGRSMVWSSTCWQSRAPGMRVRTRSHVLAHPLRRSASGRPRPVMTPAPAQCSSRERSCAAPGQHPSRVSPRAIHRRKHQAPRPQVRWHGTRSS